MGVVLAIRVSTYAQSAEPCATPNPNRIAPCISNPARVVVWDDSLNGPRGSVVFHAPLRGSAINPQWSGTGTGLLTSANAPTTRYLFSEPDRQRGAIVFALTTPDPDGAAPGEGVFASLSVTVPLPESQTGTGLIGLGKKVFDPTWLPNGADELVYQLTVANMGKHPLANVQLEDDHGKQGTIEYNHAIADIYRWGQLAYESEKYQMTGTVPQTWALWRGSTDRGYPTARIFMC